MFTIDLTYFVQITFEGARAFDGKLWYTIIAVSIHLTTACKYN